LIGHGMKLSSLQGIPFPHPKSNQWIAKDELGGLCVGISTCLKDFIY